MTNDEANPNFQMSNGEGTLKREFQTRATAR
jgi:hypothetical protein